MSSKTSKISKAVGQKKVGSFVITRKKVGKVNRMNVDTVDGSWSLSVREDSKLYYMLEQCEDGDMSNAVVGVLLNAFVVSNCMDARFQSEVMNVSRQMLKA